MTEQQGRVVYVCPECGESEQSRNGRSDHWTRGTRAGYNPRPRHWHGEQKLGLNRYVDAVPTRVYTEQEIRERLKAEADKRRKFAEETTDPDARERWREYALVIDNAAFGAFQDAAAFPTPDEQHPEKGSNG